MQKQDLGLGSGVIVSSDGMILTNNHVIEGADDILVSIGINDQKYKAKKIAGDPGTDIAVLKIDAKDLKAVTFGDSDKIRVGDVALAIGNPFGLTQSISMGVISALGRGGMGIVNYENFIQTDASINPGNSGGALVDLEGRLIGINTAIFSRSGGNQGIGFAVPANLAHSVMDNLIKNGRVVRGYLGVQPDAITEDLVPFFKTKDRKGALVSRVEKNTPAGRAGIEVGDVILEVAGKKVEGPRELRLHVSSMAPGSKVDLKLMRDGKEKVVSVELGELPQDKGEKKPEEPKDETPDVLDGVTVSDLDTATRKEFDLPEDARGVLVTAVEADSPSAAADIRRGDIIHEINRQPVSSAKEAIELSDKLKTEKKVLLRISRKGASRYVVVGQKD
jgi:serine protease Do